MIFCKGAKTPRAAFTETELVPILSNFLKHQQSLTSAFGLRWRLFNCICTTFCWQIGHAHIVHIRTICSGSCQFMLIFVYWIYEWLYIVNSSAPHGRQLLYTEMWPCAYLNHGHCINTSDDPQRQGSFLTCVVLYLSSIRKLKGLSLLITCFVLS